MFLLDSNAIIYAAKPEHADLRAWIASNAPAVSAVSVVEVLGYHKLTAADEQHFSAFFAAAVVLPITDDVVKRATDLRRQRKMTLGDALMAATALEHRLTLVTSNIKDFNWITGLPLLDPLALPTN